MAKKSAVKSKSKPSKKTKVNAVSRSPIGKKVVSNPQGSADSGSEVEDLRTASLKIDERIAELGDWRGEVLAEVRALILEADPEIEEEWKWRGVPVWSRAGIICTGETYKSAVKLTFAKGATLDDPTKLFNASLDGGTRRAIDIPEGQLVDAKSFQDLIRAAVALNRNAVAKRKAAKRKPLA